MTFTTDRIATGREARGPGDTGHLQQAAAKIITQALTTGDLRHPQRPTVALILPGLNPTGHNPQTANAINQTTQILGEALIATVLDGLHAELISTAELEQLRTTAANQPPQLITLKCAHRELLKLAVKPGTDTTQINCRRLRTHLTECET